MARFYFGVSLFFLMYTSSLKVFSQESISFSEAVAVLARPSQDSIMLRWAPLNFSVWRTGNANGYNIERYVISRNGVALDVPEKVRLNVLPVKHLPEEAWEKLVLDNKYAAIAAQALFGARFELDLSTSDVIQIVNKVRENEQRYAFALFCADMSFRVAKASGLSYVDKNVRKEEKYLYRITIYEADSLRGSVFISPEDDNDLSKPVGLRAEFNNGIVSLQWERIQAHRYNSYIVERSSDGSSFTPVSDRSVTTVAPAPDQNTRFEYAHDTIPDLINTWYYRVRGLTPFGETSEPSDVVKVKGSKTATAIPYIFKDENVNNGTIQISWEFPDAEQDAIRGFAVERTDDPDGRYKTITRQLIIPSMRTYYDSIPGLVNYYRVVAEGLNGEILRSPPYFARLIDSIPPSAPVNLKAFVDSNGWIQLSWQKNDERDLYGYRVYAANYRSEELSQLTTSPVREARFTEKVDLNTLNNVRYYKVMAVDHNQNESALSELLEVKLPDIVKPQPPVFLPVRSSENGVMLTWQPSGSTDVVRYDVYRRNAGTNQWIRLKMIDAADSVYQYLDAHAPVEAADYTLVAVDNSGLESDPATPVRSSRIDNNLLPEVKWNEPVIVREKNQAILQWTYARQVKLYRIYRSQDNSSPVLYKSVSGNVTAFTDSVFPGKNYIYTIMAVDDEGRFSALSKKIELNY